MVSLCQQRYFKTDHKKKKFSIDVLFVIRQYLAEMQLFESLESDINIDKIWGLFYKTRLIQLV